MRLFQNLTILLQRQRRDNISWQVCNPVINKCMRKYLKFSVFVLLIACVFLQTKEKSIVTNDIMLENVEALAYEEIDKPLGCVREGDVACPHDGLKVWKVFEGFSLIDEEAY